MVGEAWHEDMHERNNQFYFILSLLHVHISTHNTSCWWWNKKQVGMRERILKMKLKQLDRYLLYALVGTCQEKKSKVN